jgi:hypothetical protein
VLPDWAKFRHLGAFFTADNRPTIWAPLLSKNRPKFTPKARFGPLSVHKFSKFIAIISLGKSPYLVGSILGDFLDKIERLFSQNAW